MALKITPGEDLENLPGIGPAFHKRLANLDLSTIHDLIHYYPRRYLDYRVHTPIKDLRAKKDVSFICQIGEPKRFTSKSGKLIIQADATDTTGKIKLTWFNTPYITKVIVPGKTYIIAGKTSFWADKLTVVSPVIEPEGEITLHTKGLVPIYPLTAKLTSRFFRQKIHLALQRTEIKDPLDPLLIAKLGLLDYRDSLNNIHFPKEESDQQLADLRLSFNNHLSICINNRLEFKQLPPSPVMKINDDIHRDQIERLPFTLTNSQQKAITAGYHDLNQSFFTHRLFQGETGSGKTIIIYFLARQTLANSFSFGLLAPTEILATQHYQTFLNLGIPEEQVRLVTANSPLKRIPTLPTVFIGTHALFNQLPQHLKNPLAAVAIDEQHKFGVDQRKELSRRDPSPHLFNLTATPIPRTLALGLFGEVSITTLKQKPKDRLPVKTWVISPTRFQKSELWLRQQLNQGSKIFVVTPLIHTSTVLKNTQSAEKVFSEYRRKYHSDCPVFLIHGQMSQEQISTTVAAFKKAEQAILVSTSIIEVGIDIPEADVIIIHSAERFGLASLHQLRGRVGRGSRQSYCLVVPSNDEQETEERLALLSKYHSGLTLAKMDLRLRGSGELFGTKQHGWLPVRLKNFWNKKLFTKARLTAIELVDRNPLEATTIANHLITW